MKNGISSTINGTDPLCYDPISIGTDGSECTDSFDLGDDNGLGARGCLQKTIANTNELDVEEDDNSNQCNDGNGTFNFISTGRC